jgi:hypothetical protein
VSQEFRTLVKADLRLGFKELLRNQVEVAAKKTWPRCDWIANYDKHINIELKRWNMNKICVILAMNDEVQDFFRPTSKLKIVVLEEKAL